MNRGSNEIIQELNLAYAMTMECLQNYVAAFVNLVGDEADGINRLFRSNAVQELNHALLLATRIRTIGGRVPGSITIVKNQKSLQPLEDSEDIAGLIEGAIEAESEILTQLEKIIGLCSFIDSETMDLASQLHRAEEHHRRAFATCLKVYDRHSLTRTSSSAMACSGAYSSTNDLEDNSDDFTFAHD